MADVKKFVVYRITNNINGRVYFGSTNGFNGRKNAHLKIMSGKGREMPNYLFDIQRYGHTPDDFSFRVLARFDNQIDMLECEQRYLDMYWGTITCYNSAFEVHLGWVTKFLVAWNMETLQVKVFLSCHAVRKDLGIPKTEIQAMLNGEQIASSNWVVEFLGKKRTVKEVVKLYKKCKVKLPAHAMEPKKQKSPGLIPGVCSISQLVYRKHFYAFSRQTGERRIRKLSNYRDQFRIPIKMWTRPES